eukprot:Plantae.Rhodophyta-Rhodochaete_pulchella.ctg5879.p3 GENE.Plantae.Rhodophyta-Rhodochaete_pulchella.ctg5879~~Plantae.Rhodophyta-Rhodochaete_pulchella.ctg5879.p3  ORF type:complete len:187 (+),score=25.28 Plantae.Rhodophyta-Rhodochaete_pulchella.ctg5879:473-1033(+)
MSKLVTMEVLTPQDVLKCALDASDKDSKSLARFEQSSVWDHVRSVFARVRARVSTARTETTTSAKEASSAPEGEMDTAAERLDRAREESAAASKVLEEIVASALKNLVGIHDAVIALMDTDDSAGLETGLLEWRALGMIQEIARRQGEFLVPDSIHSLLEECPPSKAKDLVTQMLDMSTSAFMLPD